MKNILVATYFSNNAYRALFDAVKLLASQLCTFYLFNVYDKLAPLQAKKPKLLGSKKRLEELYLKSKERLTETSHRIVMDNENPLHRFKTLSEKGMLTTIISKIISEKQIDLVVMGNKDLTKAADIFFGSNTIRVLKRINGCPVLTVPEDVRFSTPQEIVFPTDYKSAFKCQELSYLIEVAKIHDDTTRVLYVAKNLDLNDNQESNKQLLDDILESVDHGFHTLTEIDVSDGITSFAENRNSDMISFINRKHFFFGSVFFKPLVKEIGYDTTVPVLALH